MTKISISSISTPSVAFRRFFFDMLLNTTESFILEFLTTQHHTTQPEITEKRKGSSFFQIFDLKKQKFSNFLASSFLTFYCASYAV